MLQQFYKDTLQSKYIKYLLNNTYIPTVPFTANIYHITKGNTYIHDGYFVTAKISDAITSIEENLKNAKEKSSLEYSQEYSKYFIKHEPYIFGRQYPGLTTNYKSNIQGYDSETHYYLGEYLRAYKAFYNIDLMPYYNCFSNEYINYLSLYIDTNDRYTVKLKEQQDDNYNIISVPIKFCQKYTIAIQCPMEVTMLPVFIGKKGLLKEKTKELNSLNPWGKSFARIDFNKPIIYESPHINSVSDSKQSALQTYDKYLKLLIQIPSSVKSSIVVLEGEFSNAKNYSQKIINTSKEDVAKLWTTTYNKSIPYNDNIAIPDSSNSSLILDYIDRQKLYLEYENKPIIFNDNIDNSVSFQLKNASDLGVILNNASYDKVKNALIKYPAKISTIKNPNTSGNDGEKLNTTSYIPAGNYNVNISKSQDGTYNFKDFCTGLFTISQDGTYNFEAFWSILDDIRLFTIKLPFVFTSNGIEFNKIEIKENNSLSYIMDGTDFSTEYKVIESYTEIENEKSITKYLVTSEFFLNIQIENKYIIEDNNIKNFLNKFLTNSSINEISSSNNLTTTSSVVLEESADLVKSIDLEHLRVNKNNFGTNYIGTLPDSDVTSNSKDINYYKISKELYNDKFNLYNYKTNNTINKYISDTSLLTFTGSSWNDTFSNVNDNINNIVITKTLDENAKSIRALVASKAPQIEYKDIPVKETPTYINDTLEISNDENNIDDYLILELSDSKTYYNIVGLRPNNYKKITLEIPKTYNNLPIKGIYKKSDKYNYKNIIELYIGSNVEIIGESAFSGCDNLETLSFEKTGNLSIIEKYAFSNCTSLTGIIEFPDRMTSIGGHAFEYCPKIFSVTIPAKTTNISNWAFYKCFSLVEVINKSNLNLNDDHKGKLSHICSYCENYVTNTDGNAAAYWTDGISNFPDSDLKSKSTYQLAILPGAARTKKEEEQDKNDLIITYKGEPIIVKYGSEGKIFDIGFWAFRDCYSLIKFNINFDSTTVTNYAFHNCPKLNKYDNISYYEGFIYTPTPNTESNLTILGCTNDINNNSIEIPAEIEGKNINTIALNAFSHNYNINKIIIPDNITHIKNYAFSDCKYLKSIIFGANSKFNSIGAYAFQNCTSLDQIEIPQNTRYIMQGAFQGCTNLQKIWLQGNSMYSLSKHIFKNCNKSLTIYFNKIPSNTNDIYTDFINEQKDIYNIIYNIPIIKFYNYELAYYLTKEMLNNDNDSIISLPLNSAIKDNSLYIGVKPYRAQELKSNPLYKKDSLYNYDIWRLESQIKPGESKFTNYLNNYMYSNLNLLFMNNQVSYAFTGRLIEYLLDNVITSNDIISKNIKRAQESVNFTSRNGIWDDNLRVSIFNKTIENANKLDRVIPMDINGFVDKDSEKLLNIQNTVSQDIIWK